ncbi:hypothetical protein [Mucilaginibacter sp.]|jgi:hypothetical protein|uniref:hypothetical protein n=1 Tax=Mucilaginibacter sp. TaxID=1882438 RepID=UPI002CDBC3E8|nr:hypothetical protein [Mucilaginibacter sp.]HTI59097.1 hypothetical protein [Mucilaginibacter sp.]
MKKTLLILFVVAIVTQVKAQQLAFKPADSMLVKSLKIYPSLKMSDSSQFKKYLETPNLNSLAFVNTWKENTDAGTFYSTMPVVKMGSNDKMPIAKLESGGINHTMPIKKITVVDPLAKKMPVTP